MHPVIKSVSSLDVESRSLPDDPGNCSVSIQVEIGPDDQEGADIFSFTAITPKALIDFTGASWGRGYLIIDRFSWTEVDRMLNRLIAHSQGKDWNEISRKLSQQLHWEFDNYQNQIQA